MSGAPLPPVIPEPFANAATAGSAPGNKTAPFPDTVANTQQASWRNGFQAITMQPVVAGGKPPLGQDVNGVLFVTTAHDFFLQSGQRWPFNAAVAAAIGGYAVGAQVMSTDGLTVWQNLTDGNTTDPDSGSAAGWIGISSYGFLTVTSTGGNVTVPNNAAGKPMIIVQGALASNLAVILPAQQRQWLVINNTTGGFTTTVRTAGGTGVLIPPGGFSNPVGVYGDGTNIYPTVPASSLIPASISPTPLTLLERDGSGYGYAAYFNQSSPVENPPVGSVFVQNTSGDGFFRKASLAYLESVMALQSIGGQIQPSQIVSSAVTQFTNLILASAALTGVPTAPTAAIGTANAQVANTAFVNPPVTISGNSICIPMANGYKLQMGFASGGSNIPVSFPQTFSSRVWFTGCTTSPRNFMGGQGTNFTSAVTLSGMTITVDPNPGSGYWIAIGQ
jgi:hypothetical protein